MSDKHQLTRATLNSREFRRAEIAILVSAVKLFLVLSTTVYR